MRHAWPHAGLATTRGAVSLSVSALSEPLDCELWWKVGAARGGEAFRFSRTITGNFQVLYSASQLRLCPSAAFWRRHAPPMASTTLSELVSSGLEYPHQLQVPRPAFRKPRFDHFLLVVAQDTGQVHVEPFYLCIFLVSMIWCSVRFSPR